MFRVVILRGNARVAGPHLGPVNWLRLFEDVGHFVHMPRYGRGPAARGAPATCSFSGRDQRRARRLIAGPDRVFICDSCARLCQSMLEEP